MDSIDVATKAVAAGLATHGGAASESHGSCRRGYFSEPLSLVGRPQPQVTLQLHSVQPLWDPALPLAQGQLRLTAPHNPLPEMVSYTS